MYKVGDKVLFIAGEVNLKAFVVFVDKDGYTLVDVPSNLVRGARYSPTTNVYGDNLIWAKDHELAPYIENETNALLVYCSHAYGGKSTNVGDMTKKLRHIHKTYGTAVKDKEFVFVSPLNGLPFYDLVDYDEGMRQCIALLSRCQMMVVFGKDWEKSEGVKREIKYCEEHNISVVMEDVFMEMLEGKK